MVSEETILGGRGAGGNRNYILQNLRIQNKLTPFPAYVIKKLATQP